MKKAETSLGAYITSKGEVSHFSEVEFICRCGCGTTAVDEKLIDFLEALRNLTGDPIHVSSGVRCVRHNHDINGAQNSFHVPEFHGGVCMAADVVSRTYDQIDLSYLGSRLLGVFYGMIGGIGIAKGFVHFDVRLEPESWRY